MLGVTKYICYVFKVGASVFSSIRKWKRTQNNYNINYIYNDNNKQIVFKYTNK